jgi:hypothetical protein
VSRSASKPTAARQSRQQYTPGQYAPVNGVYCVHHGANHRQDHDVVILRDEEFPACRSCRGDVRYTLTKEARYVTDDFDLAAPTGFILMPKKPAARAQLAVRLEKLKARGEYLRNRANNKRQAALLLRFVADGIISKLQGARLRVAKFGETNVKSAFASAAASSAAPSSAILEVTFYKAEPGQLV